MIKNLLIVGAVLFYVPQSLAMLSVEADHEDCLLEIHNVYESLAVEDSNLPNYEYKASNNGPLLYLRSHSGTWATHYFKEGSRVIQKKVRLPLLLSKPTGTSWMK